MIDSGGTLTQAIGLHRQGRLGEAVSLYQQVLAQEPRNVEALRLLGLAMVTRGEPQRAVSLIGAAVKLQPSSAILHTNLGGALQGVGRYEEALACYARAVSLERNLALAHRGRGTVLLLLGRIEAAAQSLGRAAQLAPADDQALNALGAALRAARSTGTGAAMLQSSNRAQSRQCRCAAQQGAA